MLTQELNSRPLKWCSKDEFHDEIVDFLSYVNMLTGALLPDKKFMPVLVEIIKQFLSSNDRYYSLTLNEIRLAFHLNNQGEYGEIFRHYNRDINAEFIGDVLFSYVKKKQALYTRLPLAKMLSGGEVVKPKEKPVPYTARELREYIQTDYDTWRSDRRDFVFFSPVKYAFLRDCGFITITGRNNWNEMYQTAMDDRMRYAASSSIDLDERKRIAEVNKIYEKYMETGGITYAEHYRLIAMIRRRLYFTCFHLLQANGIDNIWKETPKHDMYREKIKTVPDQEIKDMVQELKNGVSGWQDAICERMYITANRLNHIIHLSIKNKEIREEFIAKGKELLTEQKTK